VNVPVHALTRIRNAAAVFRYVALVVCLITQLGGRTHPIVAQAATPEAPSAETAAQASANTISNAGPESLSAPSVENFAFLPIVLSEAQSNPDPGDPDDFPAPATGPENDWPQLGRDAQRTNFSKVTVSPPYCLAWKWFEVPFASRAQPVVASGVLFLGSMNGNLYARDASTGAPLWSFKTDGPIRNSAGVHAGIVVVSSHDGYTYGLDAKTGQQKWKTATGPSSTAPLLHTSLGRVYVGSNEGVVSALKLDTGAVIWTLDTGAPVLTSPALSGDGKTVFLGNEAIKAIAVDATTGQYRWEKKLQGQSLAERYPVVRHDTVFYRSQPLDFFHLLLQGDGDGVLNQAGSVASTEAEDWRLIKPKIVAHLTAQPWQQTFFALHASNGNSRGVVPILYTFGDNDIPNTPVIRDNGEVIVTYRARKGIQNSKPTVHVTTKYDAELGKLDLNTLDIAGLTASAKLSGRSEWRLTSDEPAIMTMGGDILWIDSWERFGGLNVKTGANIHVSAIGKETEGCNEYCGGTPRPFFPLSGNGPSWPFPANIVGEGEVRAGAVVANNMVYWRVLDAGLAGVMHQSGSTCPAPKVWQISQTAVRNAPALMDNKSVPTPSPTATAKGKVAPPKKLAAARSIDDYAGLDLTTPVSNPPRDLLQRLRAEVRDIVDAGGHMMPFYLERGFASTEVWPNGSVTERSQIPDIHYKSHGSVYWYDPGELLLTMAQAYPYVGTQLQQQLVSYMNEEMKRFSPVEGLPYNNRNADWLRQGVARERYEVPYRAEISNYPSAKPNLSTFYALWLWSKNTGDWSFACENSSTIKKLYQELKGNVRYYADLAGLIGYFRLAEGLSRQNCSGWNSNEHAAVQADVSNALRASLDFDGFQSRAHADYLDPRDLNTGWSLPVFWGLTPEVGLYLNEQLGDAPRNEILKRQSDSAMPWWYLTRAGVHAEVGESSYLGPQTAWSHFLARAYIMKESQANLRKWLDRPFTTGDLYSIQKIVATIHAP
jgi:outer membrane protein assembly factor BamB